MFNASQQAQLLSISHQNVSLFVPLNLANLENIHLGPGMVLGYFIHKFEFLGGSRLYYTLLPLDAMVGTVNVYVKLKEKKMYFQQSVRWSLCLSKA